MKPEQIEINVKIILIGDPEMYELLYENDEDFRKIFKVRVEFDEEMELSDYRDSPVLRAAAQGHARRRISARSIARPWPR